MNNKPSNIWLGRALARRLAADERGATAIEYAILAAGIGVAVAASITSLGAVTADLFTRVSALF